MAPVPDGEAALKCLMEPYLSLVVTARNDDHGGNLLGRMQAFVKRVDRAGAALSTFPPS